MSMAQPDPIKDDPERRDTKVGWQGACDGFALAAAPMWFNWLEWILVLGAFDYLAAKSGAWLPRLAAAVSVGFLWMYFNAFFFRIQRGLVRVPAPSVERGVSTIFSSLLAACFWFGAQAIAEVIAANTG